jgi:hypothetical protein
MILVCTAVQQYISGRSTILYMDNLLLSLYVMLCYTQRKYMDIEGNITMRRQPKSPHLTYEISLVPSETCSPPPPAINLTPTTW